MKHYLCETDTSAKLISRTAFMRQLAQQPCPKGQVYIDFDDGFVYLFPYDPERAVQFTVAYGEFETEYKRFYREQQAIREGRRLTVAHLDQFDDSCADGDEMQSTSSFNALSDSDREILTGFINSDFNARELALRLGKDPSGVLKLVKRAAARLEKKIEENS